MDRQLFNQAMDEVFAAFGKQEPRAKILDAIFRRVQEWPDEFCAYACEALQDADKLPANIGRTMAGMYSGWLVSQAAAGGAVQSGDPLCPECGGEGWFMLYPANAKPGTAPYAVPCMCNRVVDCWPDLHLRRRSLDEIRASGRWTFRPPAMVRSRPPKPLGRSLQDLMASIRAGRGVPEERPDPRREMPEHLA